MKLTVKLIISLWLIFTSLIINYESYAQACNIDDWTALKAFYESTNGDNWIDNSGWDVHIKNQNEPPENCRLRDLFGVRFIKSPGTRVRRLSMDHNNLQGSIPPEIGELKELEILFLNGSLLTGSIPPEIGELSNLETLNLHETQIGGNIPAEIGNLSKLTSLFLEDNFLSGSIPPQLGNLNKLVYLNLAHNQLSGQVPAEIGNLTNLHEINLNNNQLNGNLPPELGNLNKLDLLHLNTNQISGPIPPSFGNFSALRFLYLEQNELTGNIPEELGNLTRLIYLQLQENQLSGIIPPEISYLPQLYIFKIDNNNLTGDIPKGFHNGVDLSVYNNQLSGCYHPNLAVFCEKRNNNISDGNDFDAAWEDFCRYASGACTIEGEVIFGCTDRQACNYNAAANYENVSCSYAYSNASCTCSTLNGCTNPNAINYNPFAECHTSCYFDNSLFPYEYDYVFCKDSSLSVNLKKTCTSGTFVISENTTNKTATVNANGLLTINKPSIEGQIKVVLSDETECNSAWTFNISNSNDTACNEYSEADWIFFQYPWLSNIISPLNCNDTEISLHKRELFGSYLYIKNTEGGTLHVDDSYVWCFDYPKGPGYCSDQLVSTTTLGTWACSKNIPIEGCIDAEACNYLPAATQSDNSCSYDNCISPLIVCPKNNVTSICVPVSVPPPLNLQDFNISDNISLLSELSLEVEEETDYHKYYNNTTRVYTISDETGNQKTCENNYRIANQFLQAPEVSQPGVVCEEDLWSSIKIGVEQYKIYADFDGTKGNELSICNTSGLICSTVDLGVNTDVPGKYNFLATAFFLFPDGTICESEATSFYVDVQPKPVAELKAQYKTINVGEGIILNDLLTSNTSGYWSGENIVYITTSNGENISYFSSNKTGVNKLYYTVSNGICKNSYLLILNVEEIPGCTDFNALNYNAEANIEDGSCSYALAAEFDFFEYVWLNNLVNPIDCAEQVEITTYNFESNVFIYVKNIDGGSLYLNDGTFICSDADGETCLLSNSLTNAGAGWSCFEGVFQKFDYVYSICEGESANLYPKDGGLEFTPCECPPCLPPGIPEPPFSTKAVWVVPADICTDSFYCVPLEVSPTVTTIYEAVTGTTYYGDSGCNDPQGAAGICPRDLFIPPLSGEKCLEAPYTRTNFLVKVKQCPSSKTAIIQQVQKHETALSFNIYPNPTTGKVFIDLPDEAVYQINLMNISGKVMKQLKTNLEEISVEMDLSGLPKGMYLVELRNASTQSFQKLIIK